MPSESASNTGPKYPWRDADLLEELYHERGHSTTEIAERLGCDKSTVWKWMDRYGIERRTREGDRPLEDRFWESVDRGDPDECWEWQAYRDRQGYGQTKVGGDPVPAHRVAYELEVEDPGDDWVLHHCDNPPCVNPTHLYAGDASDNNRDAFRRNRRTEQGEQNKFSKLTAEDVREIKSRLGEDETHAEIADDFGVCRSAVTMISTGDTWPHIEPDGGATEDGRSVAEIVDVHGGGA